MPGYELMGTEERECLQKLFEANGGVLWAQGYDGIRKGIFKVREFEKAVAAKAGAAHAQAVSSGTAAVYCALRALGVRAGDEVLVPAWTFVATLEAVRMLGASPVVVEIDETLGMDPADLERKITEKSKAVVPVHVMGSSCDMGRILEVSRKHKLLVMEDACQALGATYRGAWVGTLGDAGSYSFDFNKAVTTGEGGMVVTSRPDVFQSARAAHDHGHDYDPKLTRAGDSRAVWGFNFRMTELQGAIGLVQLSRLERLFEAQRKNKARLKALLAERVPGIAFRQHCDEKGEAGDTLVLRLSDPRQVAAAHASLKTVGAPKYMPDALLWNFAGTWGHLLADLPRYKGADLEKTFERSSRIIRSSFSLGVSTRWNEETLQKIAGQLAGALEKRIAA